MQAEPSDVHVTLEYRLDAELADWLPIGVLTIFCGLFLFAIAQPGLPPPGETFGAGAAIVVGIGIAALSLWRRFRRGGPVYVLSPDGIHIRWPWVKEIFIPWREIKAVDTIDITVWHWLTRYPRNIEYRGVTVALVSKEFYDDHIHIDSLFMRGPYWHKTAFIAKGDEVQCALHAEIVSVEPKLLREAVETRWKAFRGQTAVPVKPRTASVPSVIAAALRGARRGAVMGPSQAPRIVAAGDAPRPVTWWGWIKIALPLIGIVAAGSNLTGLWATDAQREAYQKRKEWIEWRARFERERKEMDERLNKQRKEMDDAMRRAFGR
jgi:hypothetical protein